MGPTEIPRASIAFRIAEGTYTPGEVDRQFSDAMNDDFENWKKEQAGK